MDNLSKDKAGEVAIFTSETLQKMVLGFMFGGHLIEGVLNFRSNLKQKRILDFAERFKHVLEENLGRELDAKDFENEDFIDVFEVVIDKVQKTRSEYKLERFRNILAKQIIDPSPNREVESYVKLLDELGDVEIIMLSLVEITHPRIVHRCFPQHLSKYNREVPILELGGQTKAFIRIGDEDAPVTDVQIDYLETGLLNKGLLELDVDSEYISDLMKKGTMIEPANQPKDAHHLTEFGRAFLDYINLS